MKIVQVSAALAVSLYPVIGNSAELTFGGGVSLTSRYISDGLSDFNNPAIIPYFEVSKSGFYAGAEAANVKDAFGNSSYLDIFGGYRNELPVGLSYDIGYTQHYLNRTHDGGGEFTLALAYPVTEQFTMTAETSYDLSEKAFGGNLGVEYAPSETWDTSVVVGRADSASSPFWEAGATYHINDRVDIGLKYGDTSSTKGVVGLTLGYSFGAAER